MAKKMAMNQVRRLPVLTREKRLCGIVSLGDLATKQGETKRRMIAEHSIASAEGPKLSIAWTPRPPSKVPIERGSFL